MTREVEFIRDEEYHCPYCGAWVAVGRIRLEDGKLSRLSSVIHELPRCEDFIRLDGIDYVAILRRKAQQN